LLISLGWASLIPEKGTPPDKRYGSGMALLNDSELLVFGGRGREGVLFNDLWMFELDNERWSRIYPRSKKVPEPREGAVFVGIGEVAYLFGGKGHNLLFNDVWKFDNNETKWTELEVKGEGPPPGFNFTSWSDNTSFFCVSEGIHYDDEGSESWLFYTTNETWTENCTDPKPKKPNCTDGIIGCAQADTYTFGGISEERGLLNTLYDGTEELSTNWENPPARKKHTLTRVSNYLVLFGGIDEGNNYLGDMWFFDLENDKWHKAPLKGDIPSPRAEHSVVRFEDTLILFGGEGNQGLLNDFYKYNVIAEEWTRLIPEGESITGRKGTCMIEADSKIYIFGGKLESEISNEMWEYDYQQKKLSKMKGFNAPEYGIIYPNCAVIDDREIYVLSGQLGGKALHEVLKYNISNYQWNIAGDTPPNLSATAIVQIGISSFLMLGGKKWPNEATKSCKTFDGTSFKNCNETDDYLLFGAVEYANKSAYYFGGVSFANEDVEQGLSNKLHKIEDIEVMKHCSDGFGGNYCELCPKGNYSSSFGNGFCASCEAGSYNSRKGMTSKNSCLPCESGSFQEEKGKSYCKACPASYYCPAGCDFPQNSRPVITTDQVQPGRKENNTDKIYGVVNIIAILTGSVLMLIFLIWLSSEKIKRLKIIRRLFETDQEEKEDQESFFKKILKIIDLFELEHNYFDGDGPEFQVMYSQRNLTGGIITVIFVLCALLFTGINIVYYIYDNEIEKKSTMSFPALKEEMESFDMEDKKVNFTIKFAYGNECPEPTCNHEGIAFSLEHEELLDGNDSYCGVNLNYTNFKLEETASIDCTFGGNAYTSEVHLSVSSFSSVRNKNSSAAANVSTDDYETVFRGQTPTVFSLIMEPSIFRGVTDDLAKLEPEKESNTYGYHVYHKDKPSPGSTYRIDKLSEDSNLNFKISLTRANSVLITEIDRKQSLITLASSLLGGVFGLLSFLNVFTRNFEKFMNSEWFPSNNVKKSLKGFKRLGENFREIYTDPASGGDSTIAISPLASPQIDLQDSEQDLSRNN